MNSLSFGSIYTIKNPEIFKGSVAGELTNETKPRQQWDMFGNILGSGDACNSWSEKEVDVPDSVDYFVELVAKDLGIKLDKQA